MFEKYLRLNKTLANTVNLVIYAGGKVHIFFSQTICVGTSIKYAIAWFTTLKFLFL